MPRTKKVICNEPEMLTTEKLMDLYDIFDNIEIDLNELPTISEMESLNVKDNFSQYGEFLCFLEDKLSNDKTPSIIKLLNYIRPIIAANIK